MSGNIVKKSPKELKGLTDFIESLNLVCEIAKDPKVIKNYVKGLDNMDELVAKQEKANADIVRAEKLLKQVPEIEQKIEKLKNDTEDFKQSKDSFELRVTNYGPDLDKLKKSQEELIKDQIDHDSKIEGLQKTEKEFNQWKKDEEQAFKDREDNRQLEHDNKVAELNKKLDEYTEKVRKLDNV